jgi:FdhD protein
MTSKTSAKQDDLSRVANPERLPAAMLTDTSTIPFAGGAPQPGQRSLAVETGVQVVFAGIPFATMMLTPSDLEDFAFGFALTEGIIRNADELRSVRIEQETEAIRLLIDIASFRLQAHLSQRRAITGRTGCGVCGSEKITPIKSVERPGAPMKVELKAIALALAELEREQELNQLTHAVHAAGWADRNGKVLHVREDVGRHNALDKAIGALMRRCVDPSKGFFVITSRCSFEMVEKAAAFGAQILVAMSAPTSLALERARAHDMTLVGIARRDSLAVFNREERINAGELRR